MRKATPKIKYVFHDEDLAQFGDLYFLPEGETEDEEDYITDKDHS
jgi:hypothetical protein